MTGSVKEKLALGTVQLGLPYGINNKTGKPDLKESFSILDKALEHDIHTLDSADAYGDSNQTIGLYRKSRPGATFNIICKFIADERAIGEKLNDSLKLLATEQLYGYMYHRFDDYRTGRYRDELVRFREEKKISKIGVSIYSLDELEFVVEDREITLIQIPINPFDTGANKLSLLKTAKAAGKEIHVRSVFLQGLFFKKPEELTGNLTQFRTPLRDFRKILQSHHLDTRQACLNMALHLPVIDRVVIGVETSEQLAENVEAVLEEFSLRLIQEFQAIKIPDRSILNPANWKP